MVHGIGIGLRPQISSALIENKEVLPTFIELSPENWMGVGGHSRKILEQILAKYPIMGHGLSLSLGSPDPLNWDFLKQVKNFIKETAILLFSEHLSYSRCDNVHLDALLPVPFRQDAADHMVDRIRQVQDFLGEQIAVENIAYYTSVAPEMEEAAFISYIIKEADCKLLLDISNVLVNSTHHHYDPYTFISQLPMERIAYIHLAGHRLEDSGEMIDSHDSPVCDVVCHLLDWIASKISPIPVLVERDNNFPDNYSEIQQELRKLQDILNKHWKPLL